MSNRAKDWMMQAERDLEQALASRKEGRHEWACFAAQQSAEKAAKALRRPRTDGFLTGGGIMSLQGVSDEGIESTRIVPSYLD